MIRPSQSLFTAIAALTVFACQAEELEDADRFRVINGAPAPSSSPEYAATVAMHSRSGDTINPFPYCSGTLIGADVVLTAAHCCNASKGGKVKPSAPETVAIYFGDGQPVASDEPLAGDFFTVSKIEIHPDYHPFTLVDDLCLIRLSAPNHTTPAIPHLPESLGLSDADAGVLLDHVGFGYSDLDKTQIGVKLHTEIPLAGLGCVVEGCPGPATDKQFSFVQDGDPYWGTCNGDSGGPAFIDRDGVTYVAGITSYGDAGCEIYGVSTNVSAYQSFIDSFIAAPPVDPGECGDGVCGPTESCDGRSGTTACASDCPGVTKGKPSSRYCYVAGTCTGPGC